MGACGFVPGLGSLQVAGSFQGDWGEVRTGLRLALLGLTWEGLADYSNQPRLQDPVLTQSYLLKLPETASEGSYRVVAYQDENGNAHYDLGEPLLGHTCSKYLLYAEEERWFWVNGLRLLSVQKGWNGYDAKQGGDPYQAAVYTDFNLYRQGQCP